jgi:hypothetical protein
MESSITIGTGPDSHFPDPSQAAPRKSVTMKTTRFTEMLIEANGFDPDGFVSWIFCPGMLFRSPDKWWGDHGRRDFPHEGVDFCLYEDRSGRFRRLDETTRIPAMRNGVVKAMFTDFLGKAVIVEHEEAETKTGQLLTVYAHTTPLDTVQIGTALKEGDIFATLADTAGSKARIAPHLHLTLGLPCPSFTYEPFVWNIMRDPEKITLRDPLKGIDWPWQALGPENRFCLEL